MGKAGSEERKNKVRAAGGVLAQVRTGYHWKTEEKGASGRGVVHRLYPATIGSERIRCERLGGIWRGVFKRSQEKGCGRTQPYSVREEVQAILPPGQDGNGRA
jgi:hypothetical protein